MYHWWANLKHCEVFYSAGTESPFSVGDFIVKEPGYSREQVVTLSAAEFLHLIHSLHEALVQVDYLEKDMTDGTVRSHQINAELKKRAKNWACSFWYFSKSSGSSGCNNSCGDSEKHTTIDLEVAIENCVGLVYLIKRVNDKIIKKVQLESSDKETLEFIWSKSLDWWYQHGRLADERQQHWKCMKCATHCPCGLCKQRYDYPDCDCYSCSKGSISQISKQMEAI